MSQRRTDLLGHYVVGGRKLSLLLGVVQKWGFLGNKIMTNLAIVQTMTYGINVLRFKPISQAR
jgi:hypothetical protein